MLLGAGALTVATAELLLRRKHEVIIIERIVTKIEDPEYGPLCSELGLSETFIPDQTTARMLADMVEGQDMLKLSAIIKNELRFFSFIAREDDAGRVSDLELPDNSRVVCIYRDDEFTLAESDTKIARGDEALLATHGRNLATLRERWAKRGKS